MYPTRFWLVQWHKHFFLAFLGRWPWPAGRCSPSHSLGPLPQQEQEEKRNKKLWDKDREITYLPQTHLGKLIVFFSPIKNSRLIKPRQTWKTPSCPPSSLAWLHSFFPGSCASLAGVQLLISPPRAKPLPGTHRTPPPSWEWVLAMTLESASSLLNIYVMAHYRFQQSPITF